MTWVTYDMGKCGDTQDIGCVGQIVVVDKGADFSQVLLGKSDGVPERNRKADDNFSGWHRQRGVEQAVVTPVHANAAPDPFKPARNGRKMSIDEIDQRRA